MDNQLVRLFFFVVLIFLLTSDIQDLMEALSTTSTMGPFFSKGLMKKSSEKNFGHSKSKRSASQSEIEDVDIDTNTLEDELEPLQFYTPIPTGRSKSKRSNRGLAEDAQARAAEKILGTLTAEEKEELLAMKTQLTKVMQEWCLPKLVCELHASVGERNTLSEAERGLLSIIRETSMNPMGEVISRYHFAAHMGQLLADVEGNGCHNFYPSCPLSGTKVLQMVKKVRIQ